MPFSRVEGFADLAVYSKYRAMRSAKRNDPIAWAYWMNVHEWAVTHQDCCEDRKAWPRVIRDWLAEVEQLATDNPMEAARLYSKVKWLVLMIRNNGERISTKGHLDWLKRAR